MATLLSLNRGCNQFDILVTLLSVEILPHKAGLRTLILWVFVGQPQFPPEDFLGPKNLTPRLNFQMIRPPPHDKIVITAI